MSTANITQQQLADTIKRLQDLGDRLEQAEAMSSIHVNHNDWLIAAQAAAVLQGIRNGFCSIEQPGLPGIDPATFGADRYTRRACHA